MEHNAINFAPFGGRTPAAPVPVILGLYVNALYLLLTLAIEQDAISNAEKVHK